MGERHVVHKVMCFGRHLSFEAEGAHGVEHSQDGDAYVGKDCHPHAGPPECGQYKHSHLDANGEGYILMCDGDDLSGEADGAHHLRRLVVHEHHVGGFDGCIGTERR